MKNVRVKSKSVRSILGRSYIVATVLGASLCAIVLSFVLKPYTSKEEKIEEIKVTPQQIAEIVPEEIEVAELEPIPEVVLEEPPEILAIPDESEQVGMFQAEEVKIDMPSSGKILYDYSDKPKKSEITGVWQTHNGIDMAGTTVVAVYDGKVKTVSENAVDGKKVVIEHKDGFVSTFCSLGSVSVTVGQTVKAGEKIGTCGNTATCEKYDTPYVHFELKKNGKIVNPHNHTK